MVMVFLTEKPNRPLAACCSVEVIKGAVGFELVGLSSREVIASLAFLSCSIRARVSFSEVGLKALPS